MHKKYILLGGRNDLKTRMSQSQSLRAATGSLIGITLSCLAGIALAPAGAATIVAPIGASAVLAFAVPSSPLATPRAIILGNTLSAAIGTLVSCLPGLPLALAAGLAVMLAIAAMSATRTLHPPGGAAALTAVLAHPAAHGLAGALLFPFLPVALNSIILTVAAIAFHRATGHVYPHVPVPAPATPTPHFTHTDIQTALDRMPDPLDVVPGDIEQLLVLAEEAAAARRSRR